jgi:hypothetical protein
VSAYVIPRGEVGFLPAEHLAVYTSGPGYVAIDGDDGCVRVHRTELPKVLEALRFLSSHPRVLADPEPLDAGSIDGLRLDLETLVLDVEGGRTVHRGNALTARLRALADAIEVAP